MNIDLALEKRIIDYLLRYGFIGKMHPWKRGSKAKECYALTIAVDNAIDQIANQFLELRKPIVVNRFGAKPIDYFECKLSKNEFLKLLERNNVMVFTSIEAFNKKKAELESQLRTMNFIDELEERYQSLHKPDVALA